MSPPRGETDPLEALSDRIGHPHLRQRLALESEYEQGLNRPYQRWQHREQGFGLPQLIRTGLRLCGLHGRGQRNVWSWRLREHTVYLPALPPALDGLRVLHLSDLHLDIHPDFAARLAERLQRVEHEVCVLTGDYRMRSHGDFAAALRGLEQLRPALADSTYAVLGNHDTLRMVPGMEAAGIRVLMNESLPLRREAGATLHLVGIDDAHHYGTHNFHKAALAIPPGQCSVLLSHTPEPYRQAAGLDFDLMLCGHTHGGQICLPGGIPVFTDARCPRRLARGPWRHAAMQGYTSAGAGASLVDLRLNCPPEITLHRLRTATPAAGPSPGTLPQAHGE